MREVFRLLSTITAVIVLMYASGNLDLANAQAQEKQIKLTERQVESFIAAQKKMATAKAEAEFEAIAKEYGFAGIEEHDDVEANILLLMDGIDPQTRAFSERPIQIKRRIDEMTADRSIPEVERKQALEDLAATLKSAKPTQFPGNIELVKKYYDRLQAALQ